MGDEDEDEDEGIVAEVFEKITNASIELDVYHLESLQEHTCDKVESNASLNSLLFQLKRSKVSLTDDAEIMGMFPIKSISSTAYYSGPLEFGDFLRIEVKVGIQASSTCCVLPAQFTPMSICKQHRIAYYWIVVQLRSGSFIAKLSEATFRLHTTFCQFRQHRYKSSPPVFPSTRS